MKENDVLKLFKSEKALLSGHFLLSSGLHSPNYMQCALLLQKPWVAEKLCKGLVKKLAKQKIDVVIGPALGGVVISYALAKELKVRSLFAERVDGSLMLRRGFTLDKNERVLVAEDVVTTGKSTKEVFDIVKAHGARIAGVASIVDRTGGVNPFNVPFTALLSIDIKTYAPESCPLCKEGKTPAMKPGSRGVK